jgi:tetrahydromethanopterin S-methyltransferase subunit G
MLPTTELEKTSLETHVDLCALRYDSLSQRLEKLEAKLDGIDEKLDKFKAEIAWMLIKTAGSVIVLLLGTIGSILKIFGHW